MGNSAERSLLLDLDRHRLDRQVCFLPFAMACQRPSIDARLGPRQRLEGKARLPAHFRRSRS